jgi:hypothetical protein
VLLKNFTKKQKHACRFMNGKHIFAPAFKEKQLFATFGIKIDHHVSQKTSRISSAVEHPDPYREGRRGAVNSNAGLAQR